MRTRTNKCQTEGESTNISSTMASCLNLIGIVLIAVPVIIFQVTPENPFGLIEKYGWSRESYRNLCVTCGAIGGILLSRTSSNSHDQSSPIYRRDGYVWLAGLLSGITMSIISFILSSKIYDATDDTEFNIFPFLAGAILGFLVYISVKRCSDYTFPQRNMEYQPIPTNTITATTTSHKGYQNHSTSSGLSYEALSNM